MIALYPIKPVYTEKILSGEKTYELRKRLPNPKTKYVVIYATYPTGKVVGYGEVKKFHKNTVEEIWELVSSNAGIDKDSYKKYFGDATQACAIEFSRIFKFVRPFSIKEIEGDLSVPQSFCYIGTHNFNRLRKRKVQAV